MNNKSVFGLTENVASALAYLGMCVTGLIVYVLEKENKTVKFNALQSLIFFAAIWLCSWLVGWLPLLGGLLAWALRTISIVGWIFLTYTAYKGKLFKIPVLGDAIWEQVNK